MANRDSKPLGKKRKYELLRSQLEDERASFVPHWRELGRYILPRRPRFMVTDRNAGGKRHNDIIDSTATFASRTLRSGMLSGIASPSRPWFRLSVRDFGLQENENVQIWLYMVTKLMEAVFAKSNFYNVLPIALGDLNAFGTAGVFAEEDQNEVIRFYSIPVGSFCIGVNKVGRIHIFCREFEYTVRQMIDRFAKKDKDNKIVNWDIFSSHIQQSYENGQLEHTVNVVHMVKENDDYDPTSLESRHKRYVSVYYESGTDGQYMRRTIDDDVMLSERGYDFFPFFGLRWEVTGEDAYATNCPGMSSLGDIKQLQKHEKMSAKAIDKMVDPPLIGPVALKNTKVSLLPGDTMFADTRDGQSGLRPIHEVRVSIGELENKSEQIRGRIRRGFYEDIMLALITSDRREMTATEVEEIHSEKLLAFGPVLEQLNQDYFDPVIDLTFNFMLRQNMIPPPPEELRGRAIKVDYISIMAQAQRSVGTDNVDRVLARVEQSAQFSPTILDKIDLDQVVDVYADLNSLPPGIVRSDDEAAAIRDQRAQAQQAAAQQEAFATAARAAKDLGGASTAEGSALGDLIGGTE